MTNYGKDMIMSRYLQTDFADEGEFMCFSLLGNEPPEFSPLDKLDKLIHPLILRREGTVDEDMNNCLQIWENTFNSLDKPKLR